MLSLKKKTTSLLYKLISHIRKVSVFKRLIISFVILILVPTLAIAMITYNTYTEEIEDNLSKLLSYTTHNVSQSITSQMEYYESLAYNLYLNEELMKLVAQSLDDTLSTDTRNSIKKSINHYLYSYLPYSDHSIFNLQIITPKDQFTQTAPSEAKKGGYLKNHQAFIDSTYYSETKSFKGHPIWFDTTREADLFYRQLDYPRPIIDAVSVMQSIPNYYLQDSIGLIVLNIHLNSILENINTSLLNTDGHLLLIGPNGTLASINSKVKGPIPTNIPQIFKQINHELSGVFSINIKGKKCLAAFEKLSNSDFYVFNLAYFDELIQSAKSIRDFTIITMLIVLIIAVLISYIVTLSITLPLNKLKHVLDRLPSKNLNVTFNDTNNDEIGVLGHHFNNMVSQIKALIHKVYLSEIHAKQLAFKKKEAELNALQMQINPHFLYNTLDIIRWEVIALEDGNGKASRMIESFSSFLRLSIPKHSELVLLSEEISHIQTYLQVINYRYTTQVSLINQLDPYILNCLVPKLTLQPLIENCVLHGFKGKLLTKVITLENIIISNTLIIRISDNGIGMPPSTLEAINHRLSNIHESEHSSIGLYNVCERIQLYFGPEYGLSILQSTPNGTTLELTLPIIFTINKKENAHV